MTAPDRSVPGLLARAAARHGDRTAVVDDRRSVTFAELHDRAGAAAAALVARGVEPGCRVGVCLRPGVEQVVALLGAACADAIAVPVLHRLRPDGIAHIARDAEMTALVTEMAELPGRPAGTALLAPAAWAGGGPVPTPFFFYD